jgi:hypothetical protein
LEKIIDYTYLQQTYPKGDLWVSSIEDGSSSYPTLIYIASCKDELSWGVTLFH